VLWLDGELSLVIQAGERRIMGEMIGDRALVDVGELGGCESLDDSTLARVLRRILASSTEEPSLSFSANI
jgi:hypothetical protein